MRLSTWYSIAGSWDREDVLLGATGLPGYGLGAPGKWPTRFWEVCLWGNPQYACYTTHDIYYSYKRYLVMPKYNRAQYQSPIFLPVIFVWNTLDHVQISLCSNADKVHHFLRGKRH